MQTQTTYQNNSRVNPNEGLLRNTLRGNAMFSVMSGCCLHSSHALWPNFLVSLRQLLCW